MAFARGEITIKTKQRRAGGIQSMRGSQFLVPRAERARGHRSAMSLPLGGSSRAGAVFSAAMLGF